MSDRDDQLSRASTRNEDRDDRDPKNDPLSQAIRRNERRDHLLLALVGVLAIGMVSTGVGAVWLWSVARDAQHAADRATFTSTALADELARARGDVEDLKRLVRALQQQVRDCQAHRKCGPPLTSSPKTRMLLVPQAPTAATAGAPGPTPSADQGSPRSRTSPVEPSPSQRPTLMPTASPSPSHCPPVLPVCLRTNVVQTYKL